MLINNFGDLKSELTRYLMHSRFSADYDLATKNFENVANRRLRVRPMEVMTTLTTTNGACQLPPDYLLWRAVIWGSDPDDAMDYVHPLYLNTKAAQKRLFTIEGIWFRTNPIDDTANRYEFHYYQKIPTVTFDPTAGNWLMVDNADLYLEGTLFELFVLQRNLELAQGHKARRDELFAEVIQLYALTTGATSPAVRSGAEYF
jgi:hypothetical protein